MTKEELQVGIASGGLKVAKIGSVLEVYSASLSEMVEAKLVQRAMRTGDTLTRGGVQEFYRWEAVLSPGSGSEKYTWNPDGQRVKSVLKKFVKQKDGTMTDEVIRTGWKKVEEV